MPILRKPPHEFSIEELDRELVIRVALDPTQDPFIFEDGIENNQRAEIMGRVKTVYEKARSLTPNEELRHLSTWELAKIIMYKTTGSVDDKVRGSWYEDNRMDVCMLPEGEVKNNVESVAAICLQEGLIETDYKTVLLKVEKYAKQFNLCLDEPFRNQPIATGRLGTGFLVKKNIIATAAHCVTDESLPRLRFVFGYKMLDSFNAATQLPERNIYRGKRIIKRVYTSYPNMSDWALVELDREVAGRSPLTLSEELLSLGQEVYVLGHPLGLPMKYGPGGIVREIRNTYFSAPLDVYSGNSGSPIFDSKTHKVVGVMAKGYNHDFRWTGKGWMTIVYSDPEFRSQEPQYIKTSEFIEYCR
jgi:V8-like Glu-specific endopeptidase